MAEKKAAKIRPFHPVCLVLFPIIFLYSHNLDQVTADQIIRPLLIILGGITLLWLLAKIIYRNHLKAALALSACIITFFSYGHLRFYLRQHGLGQINLFGKILGTHTYLLPIFTLATLAILVCLWFSKKKFDILTRLLNVMSFTIVLIPTLSLFFTNLQKPHTTQAETLTPDASTLAKPEMLPDIYYIILDGYSRDDVLRDVFGYDNSDFINLLESKRFFVAHQSRSNYIFTEKSLCSSLNFDYLDNLQSGEHTVKDLINLIRHNRLFGFLKPFGYQTITFPTGFYCTEMPNSNRILNPDPYALNEYEQLLLNTTPLSALSSTRGLGFKWHRQRVLNTFNTLADMPENISPALVFAHVLCPHPPFVFDAQGGEVATFKDFTLHDDLQATENQQAELDEYIRLYLNQITYTNSRVMDIIESLQNRPGPKPIIIFQADHGNRVMLKSGDLMNTPTETASYILNAVYFPDTGYSTLPEDLTPVNTFRIILNKYFQAELPLLSNQTDMEEYSGYTGK